MNRIVIFCHVKFIYIILCTGQRCIKRWVAATQFQITSRKRKLPEQKPKRNTFLDWNRSAEIYAFNKRLSEDFNFEKLEQAFTHRSYVIREEQLQREMGIKDPKLDIQDNTDLIMKGEKLTSEIVQNYLTKALPHAPENVIMYVLFRFKLKINFVRTLNNKIKLYSSSLHDYLLSEENLAKAAFHIGTKDIILTEVSKYPINMNFLHINSMLDMSVNKNYVFDKSVTSKK